MSIEQSSNDDERNRPKRELPDKEKDAKRLAWSLVVVLMTIEEIEKGLQKLKEKYHSPFE